MKKLLALAILPFTILGCGTPSDTEEPNPTVVNSSLDESDSKNPEEHNKDDKEQSSEQPESMNKFEEYETIKQSANLDGLTGNVVTNNPGTRIIIFSTDNGDKKIKSIFVKEKRHLKVISLNDEGLLFNGVIR